MAREGEDRHNHDRYHIRAILRALDVFEAFSPDHPTLSLMEVSETVGLNSSTTYRILATLCSRGYIEQEPDTGRYRIGVAILRPTNTFMSRLSLRERVYPLLVQLRDETRETVHLSILDDHTMEVIYLEKLEGLQPIGLMSSRTGGRSPAHCTGVGKVLLAYHNPDRVREFAARRGLQRFTIRTNTDVERLMQELCVIRQRGYAIDNAEHEEDVMCIAVPLFNHHSDVVAAMSVSGPVERISQALEDPRFVARVLELGDLASQRMGYRNDAHVCHPLEQTLPSCGSPAARLPRMGATE